MKKGVHNTWGRCCLWTEMMWDQVRRIRASVSRPLSPMSLKTLCASVVHCHNVYVSLGSGTRVSHPRKSFHWYLMSSHPASRRAPDSWCQGTLLQRCLDKHIVASLTLLIQTWRHGPIHCCLPTEVLDQAEYGDGLFHKQSRLMNKTSVQVVVECLNRRAEMLPDHRA